MRGSTRISQDGPRAVWEADRLHPVPGRPHRPACQVAGPEPGRVLTESDMNSSAVTTFKVFPGGGSLGRISTAWDGGQAAPAASSSSRSRRQCCAPSTPANSSDSTPARDHHSP